MFLLCIENDLNAVYKSQNAYKYSIKSLPILFASKDLETNILIFKK